MKLFPLFATLSLIATLFSSWPLLFFSPLLVWTAYRTSLFTTLWIAFSCGLAIDLLSSYALFPLHAIAYSVSALLICRLRLRFFEDRLSTLPLLTIICSIALTLSQLILLALSQKIPSLSWRWAMTDLILLPMLDALYGFLLFIMLPRLYQLVRYQLINRLSL